MKLTLLERNILAQLLPTEGHYSDMNEVRKLKSYLTYTSEEMKQFQMEVLPDGRLNWKDTEDSILYLADIPCTEWVTNTIQTILTNLEQRGQLKEYQMTLYEKFVKYYNNP
jgi:hypothetical protein